MIDRQEKATGHTHTHAPMGLRRSSRGSSGSMVQHGRVTVPERSMFR